MEGELFAEVGGSEQALKAMAKRLTKTLEAGHIAAVGPAPKVEKNRRMSITQGLAGFDPNHPYVEKSLPWYNIQYSEIFTLKNEFYYTET